MRNAYSKYLMHIENYMATVYSSEHMRSTCFRVKGIRLLNIRCIHKRKCGTEAVIWKLDDKYITVDKNDIHRICTLDEIINNIDNYFNITIVQGCKIRSLDGNLIEAPNRIKKIMEIMVYNDKANIIGGCKIVRYSVDEAVKEVRIREIDISNANRIVHIPKFVTTLESKILTTDSDVRTIDEFYTGKNVNYIGNRAFALLKIHKMIVADRKISFVVGAFTGSNIEELYLGDNIESFESGIFKDANIDKIVVGHKFKEIGTRSHLIGCNIEELDLSKADILSILGEPFMLVSQHIHIKAILPNKIEIFDADTLFKRNNIKEIDIPKTIKFVYGFCAQADYISKMIKRGIYNIKIPNNIGVIKL